MAHKDIRAYCPTCGRSVAVHLDAEADNFYAVLGHKFNGEWCKGGLGEDAPPKAKREPGGKP